MSRVEPTLDEEDPEKTFQLNEQAFELFFKEHFKKFCSFCQIKYGFDIEQAKDIVHSSFIKLWENRSQIRSCLTLQSYMLTIIINSSLDIIKHEKVKQQYSKFFLEAMQEGYDEQTSNSLDYKLIEVEVKTAIQGLPEQMRRIFELSRYDGLKYKAIAEELGISVKTVETQMSRALAKLKQKLSHLAVTVITFFSFHDF